MKKLNFWGFIAIIAWVVVLFISLGVWQWYRCISKQAYLDHIAMQKEMPYLTMDMLPQCLNGLDCEHRHASITGIYINQKQWLLDNRFYQRKAGYDVYTPMNTSHGVILVMRGWTPRGMRRHMKPHIPVNEEMKTIQGMLTQPIMHKFWLGNIVEKEGDWPQIVQAIDLGFIAKEMQMSVFPYILVIEPDQPSALIYDWRPVVISPEKHMGYAVQWFLLAALSLIGGMVLVYRRHALGR